MSKLFTVAGVSTLNGVVTARFANDMSRVKVLEKNGHTDIKLVELPRPMDKERAMIHLLTHPDFTDIPARSALAVITAAKAPHVKKVLKETGATIPRVTPKLKEVIPTQALRKTFIEGAAIDEAKAIVDADPVKAGRRELIRETLARVKQREAEEAEAEAERQREERALELDLNKF